MIILMQKETKDFYFYCISSGLSVHFYMLKTFSEKESAIIFILCNAIWISFMHRADSERVKNEFQEVANLQGTDVRKYFTEKTRETPDIFLPLVNITVSRVTASPTFFTWYMHSYILVSS